MSSFSLQMREVPFLRRRFRLFVSPKGIGKLISFREGIGATTIAPARATIRAFTIERSGAPSPRSLLGRRPRSPSRPIRFARLSLVDSSRLHKACSSLSVAKATERKKNTFLHFCDDSLEIPARIRLPGGVGRRQECNYFRGSIPSMRINKITKTR